MEKVGCTFPKTKENTEPVYQRAEWENEVKEMRHKLSLATIVRELEKKSVYTCSFTIREKGIDSRKMFQFQYLDRFNKRIIFTQSDITDIYKP